MPLDENTKKRLEYFAQIGRFLYLISDDNAEEDEFYKAKEALNNFATEIHKLDLDPITRDGVDYFIKYMETKINKRRDQAVKSELSY